MNRRSFITKALAGLAAVPLIGKLRAPVRAKTYQEVVLGDGPVAYWRLDELPQPVCEPPRPEDYRTPGYLNKSSDRAWEIYVHNRKLADGTWESRKGRV